MELLQNLPPAVALALGLFLLVWIVLLFLLPFMVENIRTWTRRIHAELEDLNANVERLNRLLADLGPPTTRHADPHERPVERPEPAARGRREPTISDLPPLTEPPRRPSTAARRRP